MSEWQSIETAPKDGKPLLGCFALEGGAIGLSIVLFDGEDFVSLAYTSPRIWPSYAYTGHEELTVWDKADLLAWMPLPAPPPST